MKIFSQPPNNQNMQIKVTIDKIFKLIISVLSHTAGRYLNGLAF